MCKGAVIILGIYNLIVILRNMGYLLSINESNHMTKLTYEGFEVTWRVRYDQCSSEFVLHRPNEWLVLIIWELMRENRKMNWIWNWSNRKKYVYFTWRKTKPWRGREERERCSWRDLMSFCRLTTWSSIGTSGGGERVEAIAVASTGVAIDD